MALMRQQVINLLRKLVTSHRAEVKMMVLSSFDQENHDRILKEASKKEGIEEGIIQGQFIFLKNQIYKKLQKGCSVSEISNALEQDEDTVMQIIKEIKSEN